MSDSPSGRIIEIDTFRAWAILSVLFFHYFKEFLPGQGSFVRFGWSGVDLFFVISGFVLYLQVRRTYKRAGKTDYLKYLRNRSVRIIPVYYASLFATVLLFGRDKLLTWGFFMHLSFLQIFNYKVAESIQPLYWTLGVEAQFYLFFIVSAGIFFGRRGYLSLAVITVLSVLYRYAVSVAFGFSHNGVLLMSELPGRAIEFCCGILLAKLYLEEDFWAGIRGRMSRLALLFLPGCILYILLGRMWLSGGDAIFNDVLLSTVFHPLIGLSFFLMMLPLMMLPEKMTFMMRLKPLVFLGLISYSIYVWHMFVIMALNKWVYTREGVMTADGKMILAFVTILGFATLSYYLIEKTFLKLRSR